MSKLSREEKIELLLQQRDYITRLLGKEYKTDEYIRKEIPDIVQETFLRAYRNIDSYNSERSPIISWLYAVAKNITNDYLRKKKVRKKEILFSDDVLGKLNGKKYQAYFLPSNGNKKIIFVSQNSTLNKKNGILEDIVSMETIGFVRKILSEEDEKYMRLLRLYFIEGKTDVELAKLFKRNRSTIRWRIFIGKQKLKEKLIEKGFKGEDMI